VVHPKQGTEEANVRIAGFAKRAASLAILVASMAVPGLRGLSAQTTGYLPFDRLTNELRATVNGSNLAQMRPLGTSHEGREIWVVEVGARGGAPLDSRPALLIVGNLEGDHVLGSALALEAVRNLVSRGQEPEIAELLQRHVIYVVPRLNPDGAEAMFGAVRAGRRTNARPHDDDNDGRTDEDPAEDLNGDGVITVMRVPNSGGRYIPHPEEPRLMKEADAGHGESGAFDLYWEGVDSDGDGFYNEDGPGGVDLNRNFQHAYPYWQPDAGQYMVSEPESRALMDFVIARRNIAAILTFGASDNLVTPPDARGNLAAAHSLEMVAFADASFDEILERGVFRTGGGGGGFGFGFGGGGGPDLRGAQPGRDNDPDSGRRPATTIHADDRRYFEAASEAYKEITGIERVGVNREAAGAFFQYGYFQFGVPSFSTQGWGLPETADSSSEDGRGQSGRAGRGGDEAGPDRTMLTALEGAGLDVLVDWSPFQHSQLGAVEIGGFHPYAVTNPPAEQLPELGRLHTEFVVRLAGMLPRVRIAEANVTAHGGGVFTVTAEVENAGYFPTSLRHGVVSESVQPTTVQIQVSPENVLTGDDKTSTIEKLDGSGRRESFSWVIRGEPGASVEIRVLSQKGGVDTATVTLR
jgi:hypothetical protein